MRKQRSTRKRIVNGNVLISLIIYGFNDEEDHKHSLYILAQLLILICLMNEEKKGMPIIYHKLGSLNSFLNHIHI